MYVFMFVFLKRKEWFIWDQKIYSGHGSFDNWKECLSEGLPSLCCLVCMSVEDCLNC